MEQLFNPRKAAAHAASAEKPWVEKYRPKNTDEVAHQTEVIAVLKSCISGGDMPHLLFYGPPGTGKTSTILAVSRELFGPYMRERVLELNASDERGISVVRDKIKSFASTTNAAKSHDGQACPPYKIIVLDEADAMTSAAQSALRRTIEQYSKVTRFCLICNYVSRIIEPLASRCAKFRFKPLSTEAILTRLNEVKERENVNCSDTVLRRLVELSEGDLRMAITLLQSAYRLRGEEPIELSDVEEITGVVPKDRLDALIDACNSTVYEKVQETVEDLVASGYSATQMLSQLHDAIMSRTDTITESQKSDILHRMALVDKALIDGADEYLQFMDLAAHIMNVLASGKD